MVVREKKKVAEGEEGGRRWSVPMNRRVGVVLYNVRAIDVKAGVCR